MARVNANYEITDKISLSGKHFVLGRHLNPREPAPFVTWETDDQQKYFHQGHYFTKQKDAYLDLLQRSSQSLDLDGQTIGKALLTQQDRLDLQQEFQYSNAMEDIATALAEELDYLDEGYDLDSLMADEHFLARAMHDYDNLDHSYENEALRDSLSSLLKEFPQHRVPDIINLTAEIKIPPELNALISELLSTPTAKIPEMFGPLGDNIFFDFPLSNGMKVTLDVVPTYDIVDNNKLSETEPHHVCLQLLDADGTNLYSEIQMAKVFEGSGLPGDFHISHGDLSITVTIEEEESLRRVGNQFVFKPSVGDFFNNTVENLRYLQHEGEICTIQRALTPKECDILCTGLMWECKFPDGDILHVFDSELHLPEKNHSQKPPLSQQITSAQMKINSSTMDTQNKEQER